MKKTLIGLSSLYLAIGSVSFPVYAAEPADFSKEELVYSTIDLSGDLEDLYVTNLFELNQAGDFHDYGNYDNLHLLNSADSSLTYTADDARVQTDQKRVFTQGEIADKQLPWSVAFTYKLDGKTIDPHQAAGESGQLAVDVSITPTDTENEQLMDFFDHYVLQVSTSMDLDTHFDLKSENGIISTSGNQRQVQWTVLPGQEEDHLSFTVETNQLEELDWSITGAPLSLSLGDDLFDLSKFTDPLEDLESGIAKVDDGSQDLYDGSVTLNNGISQLLGGSQTLADGTQTFASKTKELSDGTSQAYERSEDLEDGLNTLDKGSQTFAQSAAQLADGSQTLDNKADTFFTGLSDLNEGLSGLDSGLAEIEAGVQQLDSKSGQLTDGSASILEALQTLDAKVSEINLAFNDISKLTDASSAIESGISSINDGIGGIDQSIGQYKSTLSNAGLSSSELTAQNASAQEKIQALKSNIETLQPLVDEGVVDQSVVDQLTDSLNQTAQLLAANNQYIAGSEKLVNGIQSQVSTDGALRSGSQQLLDQYQAFNASIQKVVTGIATLPDELAPLQSAVSELAKQYASLDQGIQDYTAGVDKLSDGMDSVTSASRQLTNGSTQLVEGGQALESGISKLSNGSARLNQGASTLSQGISEAHSGTRSFRDGIGTLNNGTNALYAGSLSLVDGTNTLANGIDEAESGATSLANGANDLSYGTQTLREETSGLPGKTEEEINEALESFTNEDYTVHSFVDDRNDQVENVQFVIQYRAQEDTEETKTTEQPEEHKNLWQRFLDLFR
ncbi:hypothetical protein [Marinilactibacillus kalidii]|uniref:hypothetical protein n=1 Tax=Marinilactibacillus kalidii TaxID=2820274 RepID=UPI001ABEA1E3|nr:hypothetical protein [Marinilactibacillus kalidii]